jgi:DNA-binding NarL/FixJ family response regulator
MVVSYGDQLPAPNPGIALPNSPDGGEIEELFKALEARALNEWETKFVKSLRQQYDTKKTLSEKQLAILRKVAGGEAEDQRPNNEAASQELLAALAQVKTWNAPLKRGKRTYDDQDFIDSLKSQLSEKHSLTERQFEALKKLVRGYREQIANYAAIAAKFEIKEPAPRRAAPAKKAAPKKASAKKH